MMMKKMCGMHKVAWALLLVGGLNWLLVGLSGRDLFDSVGIGSGSILAKAVYILVGLAALSMSGLGKCCMKGMRDGCVCGDPGCRMCGGDKGKMEKPKAPEMPPAQPKM